MTTVISVEHLSKAYQLGQIGTGTFTYDMQLWWARMRGKPNPLARIGDADHGNRDGEEVWALKDVSFQVEQGEVLGIIGRNGAGKSTLLKILSRVTAPTSGSIKIKGRVASLLEVGTGFHPELTGRENIYLNGSILGMSRREIDRKFDEIVDFAEVEKFIDTPVKRYSSGMYVRLAFAVAAHLEPEILVVDEVLAVGDAEFQKKSLGKLSEVAQDGRTVLFVSHNIGAIRTLCLKGIYFANGKIKKLGDIEGVCNMYLLDSMNSVTVTNGVACNMKIIGSPNTSIHNWHIGEELHLQVIISAKEKIRQPIIDMAFYSLSGVRVFSVHGDKYFKKTLESSNEFFVDVKLINPGIAVNELFIDIGVRQVFERPYLALFRNKGVIHVSTDIPDYRNESLIYVPGEVVISQV